MLHAQGFSHSQYPCVIQMELSRQITNPFHRISSDLNILASAYAVTGINSTTSDLTAAFNNGLIIPEAQYFSGAITSIGVEPKVALNAANQLTPSIRLQWKIMQST